eukprot:TRINITY_DN8652_c0_g1_i1.p1 TRINITY_DN8652_c0_g1~~TRINITY_DN8652_c0_g1_i1.p1  ORF type:complete len:195 (+),score=91.38 TRINITY_DN8652_c0_g1_i1:149-733(+)
MEDEDVPKIKIVVVGDGAVGKTCLLISFTESRFPEDYVPTVFDNMKKVEEVDGRKVGFNLWDTAGQEGYERLRILSYPDTDIFLLCYAINKLASLRNAKNHWWPEITHHCPDGKFLLVGTKADMRDGADEGVEFVPGEEVEAVRKHVDAVAALECSAKSSTGIREVFVEAAHAVLGVRAEAPTKRAGGKKCVLL